VTQRHCVICHHRQLPDWRPQVCEPDEQRMRDQLAMLSKAVPFLAVVAGAEPLPSGHLNLDAVDLTLPGNPIITGHAQDQTGHTPVATKLAAFAEDWSRRDIHSADATSIAGFLQRGLRWACATYPAITDFAHELRTTYATVRRTLHRNLTGRVYGTPCGHCGEKTLQRLPGADWIECKTCKALYGDSEYANLAIAHAEREARATFERNQLLTTREAALLAGVTVDVIRQWTARGKIWIEPGPWGAKRGYLRIIIDWAQAEAEQRQRDRTARRERIPA
jgi:hypothetical protein